MSHGQWKVERRFARAKIEKPPSNRGGFVKDFFIPHLQTQLHEDHRKPVSKSQAPISTDTSSRSTSALHLH